ncbi:FecR domain-containing protein [Luteimonas sp. BDR2-5]|uniref:FecR family protein n=1 Tax=Proluteimonas luteida TaxID=2878685 RepID=UPI001E288E62|nr:FecR domain-containing protein [Luteimonas sp. BDR2-5]MCD9026765.1 FecR domain-containing protein [Luteimonas sp. BDR2-5]
MSDIHRLPRVEDVEWQAAAWIERLQADDVTDADRARCLAWRRAHRRHDRVFQDMLATYQLLAAAGPSVRATSFGIAMHAATQRRLHRWRGWTAVAAVVVLLLVPMSSGWQAWVSPRFETAIGEREVVMLPDGSSMELNSASAARVSYGDDGRVIRLTRGEAYFSVVHDPQRPFWVVAGDTWVRAVGTAFNVNRRAGGDVRVTVSEGKVKVVAMPRGGAAPSDRALAQLPASLLAAGAQADLRPGHTEVRALPLPQLTREVSWRTGTIHFENRPLREVAEDLGRYTPLRIELSDRARELLVGGSFQTNPQGVEALLTALHDGFGLQVRREGERNVYVE